MSDPEQAYRVTFTPGPTIPALEFGTDKVRARTMDATEEIASRAIYSDDNSKGADIIQLAMEPVALRERVAELEKRPKKPCPHCGTNLHVGSMGRPLCPKCGIQF
jgi:hypothetical protein